MVVNWILILAWSVLGVAAALALWFVVTLVREQERRAASVMAGGAAGFLVLLIGLSLVDHAALPWLLPGLSAVLLLAALAIALPQTRNASLRVVETPPRVDERDALFHRFYRLKPGTPEFDAYYAAHPDKRAIDDKIRTLPPLAEPGSKTYHPLVSPFQAACFDVIEGISRDIEWTPCPIEDRPVAVDAAEISARIKGFASYLGADLVGCTRLDPAHVYSHIGRSPGTWGAPITLDHGHAIALAVEMGHELNRLAPDSPTTTETAFKYLDVGVIAMVLARYCNLLGYEARAHVDGNYRVMCVPVAADAGLGELGRIGLLMTREFGPRVRLAVVTTTLPLQQDPPVAFGVQDFCAFCKKCADICPSGSVDKGEKQVHRGVEKWQSQQDTCYQTWRKFGSDCSLCMKVCPYAHPKSGAHDLVRWLIQRNHVARRVALWGDDMAYGRRPREAYPYPEWHDVGG